MIILHIASITRDLSSGVCNIVPQHVKYQSRYSKTALLNVLDVDVSDGFLQLPYSKTYDLDRVSAPFDNPDLVVFHEVYKPKYLKLSNQIEKKGIPYIIVPHGCLTKNAQNHKRLKKKLGNLLLFNRFINKAEGIQCLSDGERNNSILGKKFFVATNGIERLEPPKVWSEIHEVKIVYIGRLDISSKGIDLLLEAITLCYEELVNNNARVYIYGPDTNGIHNYINSYIRDNSIGNVVSLSDGVFQEEKHSILLDADLFIQASRSEGMPMGILEAMSFGLPCILTKGTSLGEKVELNFAGWMADNDASSIAKAIVRAIDDKEKWPRMSQNAQRIISDEYMWENVAIHAISQYESITNKLI